MGAWGPDTFENDIACDWAADFADEGSLDEVRDAIEAAGGGEYVDADVGCEALAACEVLARLAGRFGKRDAYTELLDAWVTASARPVPPELVDGALRAIDRITGADSELAELWAGDGEWLAAVADLRRRVAGR